MSQNRGTFQYGITFDTSSAKKSLQELEALMSKMDKMSVSDFMKVSGETNFHKAAGELQDLQTELKKVRTAYKDAFDPKLGVVNMQTFLQKTGSNIQDLSQKFSKMGAAGSKAFASMHANSVKISSAFRETNTLLDKMGKSLMNTIKWNISSSLVNTFTGKVQEAYGYVKHLDSSLNDIRIVTGKSADEMSRFAKEANQAAQQLGKTTTDYTEASLIYYQQGLSDSDVKNMTDLTLKASNVTGEATAQVSEYFTALKNGYQIATKDMESQVDKMAAVAATTASDLGELSTAVSRVASTAAASGVGLDSLIAQISTIESVTRQAPESIGTALKTVYARLGDLKVDGSIIDEDGFEVKLGEVSGQLQQMGVNILDVNGNMRDQQEVIEEIGAKWQNWTKEQKEAAAIAMAGKRQYNNLFALFENFDQYNKAMETSAGALGTLQKQQEIYEESTEYHLNKLTTQWEDFYDSMLDTHTINTVTDLFTGLLKGITTITDALGGGVNVLTTFVGLMGQLQSKNIVNTFIKPIIDQKFAQQFNEGNIAQVKANIQTWEKEGKTSNIAVQGQQRFAQKMDEHIGNFTKEDANAYNASIDRIGQAGAKVFEVEESIKSTKNEIDILEKSFSKVFQESLPKGVQLTKQEAEQLNKEIKNLIDNNDIKEAEDYKKALEDIFDQQMQAKVDALKQRLDELNKVEEELNNAATNNEKKRIRSSSAKELNIPHKKGGLYDTERQQEKERVTAQLNALMGENAGNYNSNKGDFGDESLVKITDLIDKTQNLAQANEILLNAKKGVVQVTKEELAQAEQIVAQKRAQHYVEVAGAVTTLASSLNSLINIGNTVNGMLDGSIPPLQGVLTIVTTLGMTIPMLITSLTKLVTTEVGANAVVAIGNKLHLKAIAGLSAETLAQNGLTAALVEGEVAASSFWVSLLGPIALVVGGIALVVSIVDKLTMSEKEATEQLENYNKTWEEHNSNIDDINSKIEENLRLIEEIKSKNDLSAQDEERIQNLQRQNKELKEQAEWEKTLALQDYRDNKKENDKAIETKEKEFNEGLQGFKKRYVVNGEVYTAAADQDMDFDTVVEEFNKQTEIINKKKAELLTTTDETVKAQLHKDIENAKLLRDVYHGDIIEIQKVAKENKADVDVQKKGAEAGGELYKDDVKEYDEKIQNYDKYLNVRLEKTQEEKDAEDKIWNDEGNKKTKFDWNTVTDEKSGATNLTNYVDAAKQAYEELSSWSSKSSSEFADFSNTQFAKLLNDMNLGRAELEQLYGKDNNLVDQILGVKDGSIQNAETIEGILKDISQIGKVDIALSDDSITAEEIQKLGIGFEDLDAYMIQNANDSEKLTKATKMWNNVMQVSLKNIGATNEELVGMERYLQGTSKDLGKLEIGNHTLQKLAYEALKAQKGLEGIKDIVDELSGMTIDQIEADPEALAKIEQIKNGLADAFNIDPDSIDNTWVEKNLDNIKAAIEKGGEEARQLLKDLSTSKETMISLGINTQLAQSQWQQLVNLIPDNIEVGAVIDDEQFIKGLANMISSGRIAASQIQNALSTIGVEIDPEKGKEIEVELGKIETMQKSGANGMSSEAMQAMKSNVVAKLTSLEYRAKPLGTGTKSSPKTGGGGGGSSKGSQPKQTDLSIDKISDDKKVEKMEAEVDRYHEIDTAIKMTENSLERYGKISDKVFGIDKVKNYKDQIAAIDKEVGQLGDKLAIARDHQDEMQKKLADKGYTFNDDGTIANYDETFKKEKSKVDAQYKDLKKRIKDYKKDIKNYNTEAYKAEEKSQKLKFTEKEEKRYDDLTAKVNKAKKEAKKKDTYDKLKDEEKKYLGLGDKEKKELKALNKKLGDQKKLKEKYDRWEYLRQKQQDAKLSKKEKDELNELETKDKTLAGFAAKLDKTGVQLDKDIEKYEKSQTKFTELIQLADEYDEHVSEFIENLIQQIDEQIQEKAEAKIELLNMKIQLELDTDNLTKQWNEFKNTINLNTYNASALAKSRVGASEIATFSRLTAPTEALGRSGTYKSEYNKTQRNLKLREDYLTAQDTLTSKGVNTQEYKNLQTAKTAFNTVQSNVQALETRRTNIKTDMINLGNQIHEVKAQYDAALAEQKKKKGKSKKDKELDQQRVDDLAHQLKVLNEKQLDAQNALIQTENQLTDATQELAKSQNNLNTAQTQYDAIIQTASNVVTAYQDGMDASVYGVNQEALKENLQKDIETLQSYGQSIAEAFNNQLQLLTDVVNETVDDFHKINDSINSYIDANKKVQDLYIKYYGTEGSLDKRIELSKSNQGRADENIKIYKALGNTLAEELNTIQTKAKTDSENFQAELNRVQSLGINKYTDYNTLVKTLGDAEADNFIKLANTAEASEKALNNVKDKIDENNSNLIDAIQQSTEEIIATRDLTIEKATLKLHNSIWNGQDATLVQKKYDWQKENNSKYYDEINSAYQIQKLNYSIQQKIDKLNNPAKQQQLNKILQDRIKLLKEQGKLTQYQVERVQKEFDIEMARIALEEAQNNKSTLRLRRDSQGNYSYQYTNDADDVAQKKQDLLDKIIDVYNHDKKQLEALQEEAISNQEKMEKELQEAMADYYSKHGTFKGFDDIQNLIVKKWTVKNEDLARQMEEVRNNLTSTITAGAKGSGGLAAQYLDDLELFDPEGMRIKSDEIYEIVNRNKENIEKDLTEYADTTKKAYTDATTAIETSAKGAFNATDEVGNAIEALAGDKGPLAGLNTRVSELESTVNSLSAKGTETTKAINGNIDAVGKKLDEFYTLYKPKLAEMIDLLDKLQNDAIQEIKKEIPGSGEGENLGETNQVWTSAATKASKLKVGAVVKVTSSANEQIANPTKADSNNFDVKKDANKNPINAGFDGTQELVVQDVKTSKEGTYIKVNNKWIKALYSNGDAYGHVLMDAAAFSGGGYTGEWESNEGKIGILHQRELVLDQKDTENILAAVRYMRDSMLLNAIQSRMSGMSSGGAAAPTQNIQITANFPNASNHSEIETAFNNLLNRANQYMGRKF